MTAQLEIKNLSMTYNSKRGSVEVLRDVSLTFEAGEFVSLVGASGCGKTTLLRIVDGLVKPIDGEIWVDGKRVTAPGPDRAFVFQQDALFPWRNVLKNVVFGLELRSGRRRESLERALELINLVGLKGFENYHPHELSGGMRQRANLARALAVNPDLLLMDEPFAALDAQTRELMQAELLKIWRSAQKTVLFVTHQLDEAIYLSDKVVVMTSRPGRVKEVIKIDFPRPRELAIKRTAEFGAYENRIWQLIEKEVRRDLYMVGDG